MPVSKEYLDYIIDQLKVFGPVTVKRMFGGAGLYHQNGFFGLVANDVLYFKVDDGNRADYEAAGSGPFRPFETYAMSYYEVPADVLEDEDQLKEWANKAVAVAMRKPAARRKKPIRDRRTTRKDPD
ncbi:MAG: TfoX/Sxy family protein [Nitrospirota bacterium]